MLAALLIRRPAALLLDEPTNHLDDGIAFLEARLRELPGAVVVTSHDRWLRRRWSGPELCLAVLTGLIAPFVGRELREGG